MQKGNVYISGQYVNEYNHKIDIMWCICLQSKNHLDIWCVQWGGGQTVCEMFSIYLARIFWSNFFCYIWRENFGVKWFRYIWLRIFWKHLILLRLGTPRLLCLGEKKLDGDGWKAKCHNSLSSSLSCITQTFSDCIQKKPSMTFKLMLYCQD